MTLSPIIEQLKQVLTPSDRLVLTQGNGQGLSIAQGIALGLKLQKQNGRVFCVMQEQEVQEGQVWEAAFSATKLALHRLTVLVDGDRGNCGEKWRAFGWAVHEVDGQDAQQVTVALTRANEETSRPSIVLAKTLAEKKE